MANRVCAQYHTEGVVCPPTLKNQVFTCGAVDNIDHNPSSRTAQDSFNGTAITLMQCPSVQSPGEDHPRPSNASVNVTASKQKGISPLPAS